MTETAAETPSDAPPDADRIAGDRYTAIRAMLAKRAPLTLEQYLQAQTLFVLMDLLAAADAQAELLDRMAADFEEIALRLPPWGARGVAKKRKADSDALA